MPPYEPQQQTPSIPAPTPAPQPAVVPATPTTTAPYVAMPQYQPYGVPDEDRHKDRDGSVYIPEDSWIYPEMMRLYSLGYVGTMNLEMRTYTRKSVLHMLEESENDIRTSDSEEAKEIFTVIMRELSNESTDDGTRDRGLVYGIESEYVRVMPITGVTLRDSYHLGQTIANDYGRPYEPGFNMIAGASTVEEFGPFSLYVRGEYQHSPSATGYTVTQAAGLANLDAIPLTGYNAVQATIPEGPIGAQNPFPPGGSLAFRPPVGPRDLRRQDRCLAGSGHGRRHELVEQCGEHLLVPHQPRGAAIHSVRLALPRRPAL